MARASRYLVAIATYRRPDELKRLLDSLLPAVAGQDVEVLVVDNDVEETARAVVAGHPLPLRYVVEPEPGTPSARNRALDAFSEEFAAILFVDDDEWVDEHWVETITGCARRTGAGAVGGAVITLLPEDAPSWLREGGWYQRRINPTGTRLQGAGTNNSLLMRSAWAAAGCPRFDRAFATTGGSDTDLFTAVAKSGALIVFCAEAVVFEDVPASRLSLRWVCRRYLRNGIGAVMIRRKYGDPLVPELRDALVAVPRGMRALLRGIGRERDRAIRRGLIPNVLRKVCFVAGLAGGLLGYRIHEYRRDDVGAGALTGGVSSAPPLGSNSRRR